MKYVNNGDGGVMNWMLPPGHMLRQHTMFVCLFVRTGVCVRVFGYACGDPRGTFGVILQGHLSLF